MSDVGSGGSLLDGLGMMYGGAAGDMGLRGAEVPGCGVGCLYSGTRLASLLVVLPASPSSPLPLLRLS